jgi:hypothetical protein
MRKAKATLRIYTVMDVTSGVGVGARSYGILRRAPK